MRYAWRRLVSAKRLQRNSGIRAKLLILVLKLIELPVQPALSKQLLVSSSLAKLALMHHKNRIGPLDRREPMCDEHRGPSRNHARKREAHTKLGIRIDRRGSLVEDQNPRIMRQRA